MDPITGVTGVVGIISLAVQLGNCVRRVQRFMDAMAGSSAQILRLRTLLDQTSAIARCIEKLFEESSSSYFHDPSITGPIRKAIHTCLEAAGHIEAFTEKASQTLDAKNKFSRKYAQRSWALQKDKIEELERNLYRSFEFLNLALTTHCIHSM